MECPKCKFNKTRVISTAQDTKIVYRQRECVKCGHRFFTSEGLDSSAEYKLSEIRYNKYYK